MSDRGSRWERQLASGIQALLAAPPDDAAIRVAVLTDGASSVRGLVNTLAHLGDRGIGGLEIHLSEASSRLAVADELTRWQCRVVLSSRRCDDAALRQMGIEADRIVRWEPGVDLRRFSPARYDPAALSSGSSIPQTGSFNVLYRPPAPHGSRGRWCCSAQDRRATRLRERARQLGLGERVRFAPYLANRQELAVAYAGASCVVLPGAHETFGLVALEAAACAAPVVTAQTTPSAALLDGFIDTFQAGNGADLLRAIERARARVPDPGEAVTLGTRYSWDTAPAAELADLERLVSGL